MRARGLLLVLMVTGAMGAGTLVAGCSSSAASPYYGVKDFGAAEATTAPVSTAGAPVDGAYASFATGQGPSVAEPAASAAAAAGSFYAAQPENQIIKTGTITIQVAAVDTSISQATDQMHALGAWLAGSDRTSGASSDMASVTYRVPVARFEDALAAMRRLGTKILNEHTESTPVGGEIIDLQSRIANLRASEKAIQAIMGKANTIGDVLTVQQRLAEVQGQIEQLSGQLAGLTDQSAYSTLTVVLVVPILPTPSPSPTPSPEPTATVVPWNAGTQAGQAAETLGEVGQAVATVLIWAAIVALPVGLALLVVLVLLGFVGRKVDPYRKRFLPFTVSQPVSYRPQVPPPGWFVPGKPAAPVAPAAPPEDKPKA